MDNYEKVAYLLLGVVAVVWLGAVIFGSIAVFPFGIIGLVVIVAIGLLFIKVLRERLQSEDDDYYSRNVDR